jgi:NAD-dependent SIR2 family protein deacetylase
MSTTVNCEHECGWTTDLEDINFETNPRLCPRCGGTIKICGTDLDYLDENKEPRIFEDEDGWPLES